MTTSPSLLAEKIYQQALLSGYDDCGIIAIDEMDEYLERFQERLEKEPTSRPFYERIGPGMKTKQRFPWAKSVIIVRGGSADTACPSPLKGNTLGPSFSPRKYPSTMKDSGRKTPLPTG